VEGKLGRKGGKVKYDTDEARKKCRLKHENADSSIFLYSLNHENAETRT
jgi:hypothetical protein